MEPLDEPLFRKLGREGVQLVDAHAHVFKSDEMNRRLTRTARLFNVGVIFASIYPFDLTSFNPTHDEVRRANELVAQVQRVEGGLVRGLVYVNPLNQEDLEMARLLIEREGFAGIGELYRACKPWLRAAKAFFELAEELDVPVLVHTAHRLYPRDRPNEATPLDVVRVAKAFPRVRIIMAHIAGGGDWEYALEVAKSSANVHVDVGGSVPDAGVVERAVEVLGPRRVLFATDCLFAESVARVEAADLPEWQKRLIYFENARGVFGL